MVSTLINDYNNNINSGIEFEVRFGYFSKDGFKPFLDKETYENIKNFLKNKYKNKTSFFKRINYKNGARETIFENGENVVCTKKKIKNIDDKEFGIRFSLSDEMKANTSGDMIIHKHDKQRDSFYINECIRVDLTCTDGKYFEIEIEAVGKIKDSVIFTDYILFISKIINKTNVLCALSEQKNIMYSFQKLKLKFNNCKNIKRDDFISKNLIFTEKTDGERNYMFVSENGEGYLINNKNIIKKIGINFGQELQMCVFDTECVFDIEKGLRIFVFDIMMNKGEYVSEDIEKRISIIKNKLGNGNGLIIIKKYYNNKDDLKKILDVVIGNKDYDGMIFSTTGSSYKDTIHLKYKQVQTLDLKIINNKGYVYDKDNNDKEFECNILKMPIVSNGVVVEFIVDKNGNLTFLKERRDKIRGNYIECALDIMYDAKNNIEPFELLGLYKKESVQSFEYRRLHNHIKKQLYTKYTKHSDNLLEIACGKGGDIHKWNCSYVLGVDINKNFINEAYNRNTMCKNCEFKQIDISKELLIERHPEYLFKKFDVCSIQFAIHYFFKSEETFLNLIKNINSCLKKGGFVIGTCMDEKVLKDINNNLVSIKKGEQNNSDFGNEIMVNFNNNSASSSGILKGSNTEYITKNINKLFEDNGFSVVESLNFSKYFNSYNNIDALSFDEKIFSAMNKTFVFIKN